MGMARLRAASSRAAAGRAARLRRAAPWGEVRASREVRAGTTHPSTRAIRGSQPGVTEMHRGCSTKGKELTKTSQKERRRTTPSPSRAPSGTRARRTSRVAQLVQRASGRERAGSRVKPSSRLAETVLATSTRRASAPRARGCHSRRTARTQAAASRARGRAHQRRGRDQRPRKASAAAAQPSSRGRA